MKMKIVKTTILIALILLTGMKDEILADETRWIAIGQLANWYSSAGCEIEVGRRHLIPDQQDGLMWPQQYRYQDSQAAKSLWIGATNFDDPIAGRSFPYKVVHVGPRFFDEKNEFMPVEFKIFGEFDHPLVLVDGSPSTDMNALDLVDEVDASLSTERLLYNVVNTSIGITMTRQIYASSQQNHDNYFIYDYVFKNTGIYDLDGNVASQTLEGVIFYFQYRYAPGREGGPYGAGNYYLPQSTSWGTNTMNETIGEDPTSGDPFRAQYSWHGKHSGWAGPGDNIGAPDYTSNGHLGGQQYVGIVTIHADKSATDKSDDPFQPATTQYIDSDDPATSANNQFVEAKMTTEYLDFMSAGHPPQSHAEAVGDGNPDEFGGTAGGYSHGQGFGPYTLEPGDSIHIVLAEGVAGISRRLTYTIGAQWFDWTKGGTGPYINPDGSETSNGNDFKNAWVETGKDSLFQTFERATESYNSGFDTPKPPPPPETFEVISGGDRINLQWSDNAQSWPNFAGYRVYRAIHKPDTTFDLIFESGEGTSNPVTNEFEDKSAIRGFDYYYYIVSYDDGSTNDVSPGVPLTSSIFYTMTNEPANLKRPPSKEKMSDVIRIVPNPYNIRAQAFQFGESDRDRIMFYNIPAKCTIRIFTERGDLVKTIEHTDGSGDEPWSSITSSRQIVVSGVYIAHFEVPEDIIDSETGKLIYPKGESAIKKFIIIR